MVLRALLDVVLPKSCCGCGHAGVLWCRTCAGELASPRTVNVVGLPSVWAAGTYDGSVKRAIHEWKESGVLGLSSSFAPPLAHAVVMAVEHASAQAPFILVPVPSSAAAMRRRGASPVTDVARQTAQLLTLHGLPTEVDECLAPARARHDQAGLGLEQRARNMRGSMRLRHSVAGRVIVIDDVVTTGATLREAVRCLPASAELVGGAALAATVKRHRGSRLSGP
jgi:predicted amidophosphoribosyltransferase